MGFFFGEPKIRWKAPLPRVPFVFVGAGGRLMRAWRVNMNSSLSVAILSSDLLSRVGGTIRILGRFWLLFGGV